MFFPAKSSRSREPEGLSTRHLPPLRGDLKCFARDFNKSIADVTSAEIDDWLRGFRHVGVPVSGRTRNNLRTSVGTLFSFAKRVTVISPVNYPPRRHRCRSQKSPKMTSKS